MVIASWIPVGSHIHIIIQRKFRVVAGSYISDSIISFEYAKSSVEQQLAAPQRTPFLRHRGDDNTGLEAGIRSAVRCDSSCNPPPE